MADIATRRELRRRRILENSESRLQKISGQIHQLNATDNHENKWSESDLPASSTISNVNDILLNESIIHSPWDNDIEINNGITEAKSQSKVDMTTHLSNQNIHDEDQNRHNTEKIHTILQNRKNQRHIMTPDHDIIDNKLDDQTVFTSILINRSIYIFLAAIMNTMMILRMETTYGTSIIIPFLLIFFGRLWIIRQYNSNQHNTMVHSMLITALILCNVRPNIIYTLKKIFNFANELINDLAIFILSFVFMYNIIAQYWIDDDASSTNKVEIIVDRHAT